MLKHFCQLIAQIWGADRFFRIPRSRTLNTCIFLMQSARRGYEFHSEEVEYHTSILVFDLQEFANDKLNFMYRDDIPSGCVAIRVGKVGIIYVSDGGAQERIARKIE